MKGTVKYLRSDDTTENSDRCKQYEAFVIWTLEAFIVF
jgi:hypothetical protein